MKNLKINHLAVVVCIIISFALGFVWYGPLFGEQWMSMIDIDIAQVEANPPGPGVWITNIISSVAPLYLLAWLFTKLDVTSGVTGAIIGFLISFCFHHLSVMTGNMFAGEPYALAWITGGYSLALTTISGFILGAWTKRD